MNAMKGIAIIATMAAAMAAMAITASPARAGGNRHAFVDKLKGNYGPRIVDMERWLAFRND